MMLPGYANAFASRMAPTGGPPRAAIPGQEEPVGGPIQYTPPQVMAPQSAGGAGGPVPYRSPLFPTAPGTENWGNGPRPFIPSPTTAAPVGGPVQADPMQVMQPGGGPVQANPPQVMLPPTAAPPQYTPQSGQPNIPPGLLGTGPSQGEDVGNFLRRRLGMNYL